MWIHPQNQPVSKDSHQKNNCTCIFIGRNKLTAGFARIKSFSSSKASLKKLNMFNLQQLWKKKLSNFIIMWYLVTVILLINDLQIYTRVFVIVFNMLIKKGAMSLQINKNVFCILVLPELFNNLHSEIWTFENIADAHGLITNCYIGILTNISFGSKWTYMVKFVFL